MYEYADSNPTANFQPENSLGYLGVKLTAKTNLISKGLLSTLNQPANLCEIERRDLNIDWEDFNLFGRQL